MNIFKIGQRVKIINASTYGGVGIINDTGVITRIRERYKNTPNEYIQYKVYFEEKQNSSINSLDDLYENYSIQLINNADAELP
jgi:hypothetical protein